MWQSKSWSQHKGSGGSRQRWNREQQPGVSGDVLFLQLSLFNMDPIPCFLTSLEFDLVLQPRSFYRDML